MKKKPVKVEETAAAYAAKKPAESDKAVTTTEKIAPRSKKLDLDTEEIELHAAVSAAAARDLGR